MIIIIKISFLKYRVLTFPKWMMGVCLVTGRNPITCQLFRAILITWEPKVMLAIFNTQRLIISKWKYCLWGNLKPGK